MTGGVPADRSVLSRRGWGVQSFTQLFGHGLGKQDRDAAGGEVGHILGHRLARRGVDSFRHGLLGIEPKLDDQVVRRLSLSRSGYVVGGERI
jgi:hypothetical protein